MAHSELPALLAVEASHQRVDTGYQPPSCDRFVFQWLLPSCLWLCALYKTTEIVQLEEELVDRLENRRKRECWIQEPIFYRAQYLTLASHRWALKFDSWTRHHMREKFFSKIEGFSLGSTIFLPPQNLTRLIPIRSLS